MNIGGMGTLELLIVLLVAFIFLGPERMADAAKFLGKLVRDVRRMTAELPELTLGEDDSAAPTSPPTRRGPGRPPETGQAGQGQPQPPEGEGPVAHRAGSLPAPQDGDSAPTRERP